MIYSEQHRAVVYQTDSHLAMLAATVGGQSLSREMVAVPATLPNLQGLTGLGEDVPAPMELEGYDWPIRAPWRPLAHQKITANFLALHKRAFCLNDMGTMKTLSALWAADFLMEMARRDGDDFRALVVAPLSILRSVWADAIFQNFIGRRTVQLLHGSADARRKALSKPADFYIINTEGLGVGFPPDGRAPFKGLAADLANRTDIRLAIVDEAATYRDGKTKKHRVARKLIGDRDYLWLMTGTPTPNGPLDAYGLAKLVNNAHGESFRSYKERVMMSLGPFKWVPRQGASAKARQMLTPAIRYAIEDCVELPPCTMQMRDCEMSHEQRMAYLELQQECVLMVKQGEVHAVNQAVLRMKLIQIACGTVYDKEHKSHELDCAPRLQVLMETIEQCNEKVIIFAPLTNTLNMLHRHVSKQYASAIINGAVAQNDRAKVFRAFQSSVAPRVILADPATMAHGVTLTAASTIIWYAPTDKTELFIQANKRIDRPGQTKATTIVQMAATHIEREIYARLENNQSMQGVILKLAEGR